MLNSQATLKMRFVPVYLLCSLATVSATSRTGCYTPAQAQSSRAAKIHVSVYPLFLQLACLNSKNLSQNPFKLSEVSDSSKIAREPTPFGQENSYSRDAVG